MKSEKAQKYISENQNEFENKDINKIKKNANEIKVLNNKIQILEKNKL